MKTIEETNGHGIPCGSSPPKDVKTNTETSGYIRLYDLEDKPDPAWSFDAPRNPVTDALNLLEREISEKSKRDLAENLEELAKIRERLTK